MWIGLEKRSTLEVKVTRSELLKKVIGFAHGKNSHGNWLLPYKHDEHCGWCDKLVDFIWKILDDYNEAEGVWYPK